MAAEKCFDSSIKNAKYTVTREFSFHSDNNSEKGVVVAVESSPTGEFKEFGLTSGCVESQELKSDVVNTADSHQEPENLLSIEDIVDLESRIFNKLQLLRNLESGSGRSSVKMKLIDDTAVIEPFSSIPGLGHQKKAKLCPRRKGKCEYSREEMVAMRFIGVVNQKRLWRDIYQGLGSVAQEYATLVAIPPGPIASAGSGRMSSMNIAVHPNIIRRPFYAQNWQYVSQASPTT